MKRGKKSFLKFIFILSAIMVLFAIGVFSGFFAKITGDVTVNKGLGLNITVGTPIIKTVYNSTLTSLTLNAGPYYTGIVINFTAYHGAGTTLLNDTSAKVNISLGTEAVRENVSCLRYQTSTYEANYTCNVTMWWFDGAGDWTITASILDNNSNFVANSSTVFSLGATTGFDISPTNLTWNAIGAGTTNQTATNDPLVLNNTGNQPIGTGIVSATSNISINATNLEGETDNAYKLFATNFSVSTVTGGACTGATCTECAGPQGNLSNSLFVNVTAAFLNKGNYTKNDGSSGQENLYFCLRVAGSELTSQSYSTKNTGPWIIRIG
jgi:hypothetical protein